MDSTKTRTTGRKAGRAIAALMLAALMTGRALATQTYAATTTVDAETTLTRKAD